MRARARQAQDAPDIGPVIGPAARARGGGGGLHRRQPVRIVGELEDGRADRGRAHLVQQQAGRAVPDDDSGMRRLDQGQAGGLRLVGHHRAALEQAGQDQHVRRRHRLGDLSPRHRGPVDHPVGDRRQGARRQIHPAQQAQARASGIDPGERRQQRAQPFTRLHRADEQDLERPAAQRRARPGRAPQRLVAAVGDQPDLLRRHAMGQHAVARERRADQHDVGKVEFPVGAGDLGRSGRRRCPAVDLRVARAILRQYAGEVSRVPDRLVEHAADPAIPGPGKALQGAVVVGPQQIDRLECGPVARTCRANRALPQRLTAAALRARPSRRRTISASSLVPARRSRSGCSAGQQRRVSVRSSRRPGAPGSAAASRIARPSAATCTLDRYQARTPASWAARARCQLFCAPGGTPPPS